MSSPCFSQQVPRNEGCQACQLPYARFGQEICYDPSFFRPLEIFFLEVMSLESQACRRAEDCCPDCRRDCVREISPDHSCTITYTYYKPEL